jgi:hypothetical protein
MGVGTVIRSAGLIVNLPRTRHTVRALKVLIGQMQGDFRRLESLKESCGRGDKGRRPKIVQCAICGCCESGTASLGDSQVEEWLLGGGLKDYIFKNSSEKQHDENSRMCIRTSRTPSHPKFGL